MTTQFIDGSYPNGYRIASDIDTLDIGTATRIGSSPASAPYGSYGHGVATDQTRTAGVTISNAGSIYGIQRGIEVYGTGFITNLGTIASNATQGEAVGLKLGGTIVNGSSSDSSATMTGWSGIDIGQQGTIVNYGTIAADAGMGSELKDRAGAIFIGEQGSVTNATGAVINSSILIGGPGPSPRGGQVVNNGVIGAQYASSGTIYDAYSDFVGPGVVILGPGSVTNGLDNYGASIAGGVSIKRGMGTVENYGEIGGGLSASGHHFGVNPPASKAVDTPSVLLGSGGSIVNGSTSDVSADLEAGITATRGLAAIRNYGTIGDQGTRSVAVDFYTNTYTTRTASGSISLGDGGSIANGASTDTAAVIQGNVRIVGGAATVDNYGTIGSSDQTVTVFNYDIGFDTDIGTTQGPGVWLDAGGTVVNGSSADKAAVISGGIRGRGITVDNFATVTAGGSNTYTLNLYYRNGQDYRTRGSIVSTGGIQLLAGGTVISGGSDDASATIGGGVTIAGGAGFIENYGIVGGGSSLRSSYFGAFRGNRTSNTTSMSTAGVALSGGGTLINGGLSDTAALIDDGVSTKGNGVTIDNFGSIGYGTKTVTKIVYQDYELQSDKVTIFLLDGIDIAGTGVVVNGSTGDSVARIDGGAAGVLVSNGIGQVSNFGTIDGHAKRSVGVDLKAGGIVQNGSASDAAATIAGTTGVQLYGSGTVTNYGAISGRSAIVFHSTADMLIEEGSGLLTGTVSGGGGTLVLDGKAGVGALSGLGSSITGFSAIDVASGAIWLLSGDSTIAAGIEFRNDGRVGVAESDTLTLGHGMLGSGMLALRQSATAEIAGVVSSTETVVFTGTYAELALDTPSGFQGTVSNLGGGGTDMLKLAGFGKGTMFSFTPDGTNTGGTLSVTDGARHAQIALLGQFAASGFHAAISAHYTVFTYTDPHATTPQLAPGG